MQTKDLSRKGLQIIQYAVLLVIALATLVALVQEILLMVELRKVRLADLLLLFIYLEVLSMVHVYLDSGHLPVRLPIYIAIVALARYVILDTKSIDFAGVLFICGGALLLALAVLVIRYGHVRYPYEGSGSTDSVESGKPVKSE